MLLHYFNSDPSKCTFQTYMLFWEYSFEHASFEIALSVAFLRGGFLSAGTFNLLLFLGDKSQ